MDLPTVERSGVLHYLLLDPVQFGFYLQPYGPGQSSAVTAADVLASDPSILAVVDGAMASPCGSDFTSHPGMSAAEVRRIEHCRTLDYRYVDRARGIDVPGRFPHVGGTIGVAGGRAFFSPDATVPANADVAIQAYPSIVEDGRNIANDASGSNGQALWRGGLGILRDGRMVYALGIASMRTFAAAMIALGCTYVIYLDGGGSASMQVRGGVRIGSREDRPVASFLTIREAPSALAQGWKPMLAGVAVGALALGVVAVVSRSR